MKYVLLLKTVLTTIFNERDSRTEKAPQTTGGRSTSSEAKGYYLIVFFMSII